MKDVSSGHKGVVERQKNVSTGTVIERPISAPKTPAAMIEVSGWRM